MEKRYIDLIHELRDCETARNFVLARAEAAEADARECRAERAHYGDAMTGRLADAEAERDALREALEAVLESLYATHGQRGTDTALDDVEAYISTALAK